MTPWITQPACPPIRLLIGCRVRFGGALISQESLSMHPTALDGIGFSPRRPRRATDDLLYNRVVRSPAWMKEIPRDTSRRGVNVVSCLLTLCPPPPARACDSLSLSLSLSLLAAFPGFPPTPLRCSPALLFLHLSFFLFPRVEHVGTGEVSVARSDSVLAAPRPDLQHPAAEHALAHPEGGTSSIQAHQRRALSGGGSFVS